MYEEITSWPGLVNDFKQMNNQMELSQTSLHIIKGWKKYIIKTGDTFKHQNNKTSDTEWPYNQLKIIGNRQNETNI